MRQLLAASTVLLTSFVLPSTPAWAEQTGRMSVSVVATGKDSTQSQGEHSEATFTYKAAFTIELKSDGEASDINMYDPDYQAKALEAANATMAKMQAALRGEFSDEEGEDVEPDNRYVLFTGDMQCPATLSIVVNEKLEGAYADVGGMQPYTMTYTATSEGLQQERDMLCVTGMSVLDIKDDTLYRSTIGFPEVTGHYVFSEANRGNIQDDTESRHNALPPVVGDYVFNTLRVAPTSGSVKTQLKLTAPVVTRPGTYDGYDGSVDVEITWDFTVEE